MNSTIEHMQNERRRSHSPSQTTREKIRQALLGHPCSEETRAKIRAATLKQIAEGRTGKMSEAARKRQSERMKESIRLGKINLHRPCPESVKALLRQRKHSPERRAAMRASAIKQAAEGRVRYNPEALAMARIIGQPLAQQKTLGGHGFGRAARGRTDHANACAWRVRSPTGVEYEFTNAYEWCRRHEHLFIDGAPQSKIPLWLRAANGFSKMKEVRCSWRGWTLIASFELEDWLQRLPATRETTTFAVTPPSAKDPGVPSNNLARAIVPTR